MLRKLLKDGNYSRVETIRGNMVCQTTSYYEFLYLHNGVKVLLIIFKRSSLEHLYHYQKIIFGKSWLAFEKKPFQFLWEIWIQVVVISYYRCTYHIPSNSILPTIHPLFISKLDLFFWIFTPLNGVPIQIADMGKPFWGKPLWENLELIVICVSWIMDYTIKVRCIRDRSKTTWRKFSPILSPYPSSGQKWIFYILSTVTY